VIYKMSGGCFSLSAARLGVTRTTIRNSRSGGGKGGCLVGGLASTARQVVMPKFEERIGERVKVEGDCWIWQGAKAGIGYARCRVGDKYFYVHRLMYELLIGPIPKGLTLDHLCRRRDCVNPFHCEPVTMRENVLRGNGPAAVNARKTHCVRGHSLSGSNLYIFKPTGARSCKACDRERKRQKNSAKLKGNNQQKGKS
jgi:hypothetical protein